MAEQLYLVTKSVLGGAEAVINGVVAVLINKDDGQTAAQIKASAASACDSAFGADAGTYPATYFDTSTKVNDLAAGPLKDNLDAYVISPNGVVPTKVEGP